LGHIIYGEGISVDLEKTKVMVEWPRPSTKIEIHSFLGLIRYYRRFIDGFAHLALLMTKLTRKEKILNRARLARSVSKN